MPRILADAASAPMERPETIAAEFGQSALRCRANVGQKERFGIGWRLPVRHSAKSELKAVSQRTLRCDVRRGTNRSAKHALASRPFPQPGEELVRS